MKKKFAWGTGIALLMLALIFVRIFNHGSSKVLGDSTTEATSDTPAPTTLPTATPAATGESTPEPAVTPARSCMSPSQATAAEGQTGCVVFTGYAYTSASGQMYLDQSTTASAPFGFSVYIPAGSSYGSEVLTQFSGRQIDVTGTISNYNGQPEIQISNPTQIQLAQ